MKQKDLFLIIVVVIISVVVAVFLSNSLITAPKNRQQAVEIIDPISTEFPEPDKKYFNAQSVDPTQIIKIGNNSNTKPFNTSQ